MAMYKDFVCRLQVPEVDLAKLDELKKKLHGIIDGDEFMKTMTQLEANASHVAQAPTAKAVKGVDVSISGGVSGGKPSVQGTVTIHF